MWKMMGALGDGTMGFFEMFEREVEVGDGYGGIGWRDKILMVMIYDIIGV